MERGRGERNRWTVLVDQTKLLFLATAAKAICFVWSEENGSCVGGDCGFGFDLLSSLVVASAVTPVIGSYEAVICETRSNRSGRGDGRGLQEINPAWRGRGQ